MTTTAQSYLRGLPYFSDLPDDLLERVWDASDEIVIAEDEVIIEEGSHSEEMYVVVDGELVVTKRSEGRDVELGRILAGNVVGEIALLDNAPRTASVRALTETTAIRVPVRAFEDLLSDPRVVRRMFRTVTSRLRGIEDTLRHEERMAALGKMAAQLMHELNNPSAAVARSSKELARLQSDLTSETETLLETPMATVADGDEGPTLSALERGDAEQAIASWLTDLGVADSWDVAPPLVQAGWTIEALENAVSSVDEESRPHMARWLGLSVATQQVVGELGIAARRISELVRVVKEYSFLDRAPVQEVDVRAGIMDTLILLKHKLREIDVHLDFDEDVQRVEAAGRDLNQVWTNLVDNASDAMPDGGTLTITGRNEGESIVITFSDTGHGMPPEVASRIFDPFFTTKEPGKGTGLGLHTVHTIISRNGGEISVSSDESGTTFRVRLPAVA